MVCGETEDIPFRLGLFDDVSRVVVYVGLLYVVCGLASDVGDCSLSRLLELGERS